MPRGEGALESAPQDEKPKDKGKAIKVTKIGPDGKREDVYIEPLESAREEASMEESGVMELTEADMIALTSEELSGIMTPEEVDSYLFHEEASTIGEAYPGQKVAPVALEDAPTIKETSGGREAWQLEALHEDIPTEKEGRTFGPPPLPSFIEDEWEDMADQVLEEVDRLPAPEFSTEVEKHFDWNPPSLDQLVNKELPAPLPLELEPYDDWEPPVLEKLAEEVSEKLDIPIEKNTTSLSEKVKKGFRGFMGGLRKRFTRFGENLNSIAGKSKESLTPVVREAGRKVSEVVQRGYGLGEACLADTRKAYKLANLEKKSWWQRRKENKLKIKYEKELAGLEGRITKRERRFFGRKSESLGRMIELRNILRAALDKK